MSNRYSTFPDKLDELKLLSEVQNMTLDQKQKASRCNELSLKPSLTVAEENEFLRLVEELKGFNISSVDWNRVVETLMNTQEYIKNNILSDVGEMADNAEEHIRTYTEEMLDEVYSVTESSKIEINNVKADAISSVQAKAEELIAEGNIGVDTLKGYVVLQEASDRVRVNIPEYNKSRDILMVYINGSLVSEGVVYTMMADNFTIKSVEGTWDIGTVFNFIVNKKTIFKLDYYDVGLIEDGSVAKLKLTQELQDKITEIDNKQNIYDETLETNNKEIVPAINELNNVVVKDVFKVGDLKITRNPEDGWLEPDGRVLPIEGYNELFNALGLERGISISPSTSNYVMTGLATSFGNHRTQIMYKNGVHYFMTYTTASSKINIQAYYTEDEKTWNVVTSTISNSSGSYDVGARVTTCSIMSYATGESYSSVHERYYYYYQSITSHYFDVATKTIKTTDISTPSNSNFTDGVRHYYNDNGGMTFIDLKSFNPTTEVWTYNTHSTAIINGVAKSISGNADALTPIVRRTASLITQSREGLICATESNICVAISTSSTGGYTSLIVPFPVSGKVPQLLRLYKGTIIAKSEGDYYLRNKDASAWTKIDSRRIGFVFDMLHPLDLIDGEFIAGYDLVAGWYVSKLSDMINWDKIDVSVVDMFSATRTPIASNTPIMHLSDGSHIRSPFNTSTRNLPVISETEDFVLPKMDVPLYTYMKVR